MMASLINDGLLFLISGELDVGISAKVQVERSSTQFYRLPIDPNLFKLVNNMTVKPQG